MIFSMISKIEVALRVRLVEALLIHDDVVLFGKLNDAFSVTLNVAILC